MRFIDSNRSGLIETRRPAHGFSLIELLVVVAIIAILASLLLPTLAKARERTQTAQCLSNMRQLTLGWLMYADDHDGLLCPNAAAEKQGWVEGTMNFDYNFADNTNTQYLVSAPYAKLAGYIRSSGVYHCPSDKSIVHIDRKSFSRVRTVSMNDAVGSNASGSFLSPSNWKIFKKLNDITSPTPGNLWVLIEQHIDSIDDGRFVVDCDSRGVYSHWIDFPANFHNRATTFAYADGHSETHRWAENRTLQPNRYCGCLSHYALDGHYVDCPNSSDMAWLQERTSGKRK